MNRPEILARPESERFYLVWRTLRVAGFSIYGANFHASALCPDVPIESPEHDNRVSMDGTVRSDFVGLPAEKVPALKRRVLIGV